MTALPARHGNRTWFNRIAATLIGLALSLVLVELTLRLFDLAPVGGIATVTQEEFDRLPGIFSPGQRLLDRQVAELPYQVTIDSLGYRGTTHLSRIKPPGAIRILLLGDSFTFGYLVDDDETLPAQLEHRLHARCGGSIQVINAGIGGTSIETASVMADRALSLGLDLAVLTFTENDVSDLATPMWNQLTSNRAAKSRFPVSLVYPMARTLAVWNLLLEARTKWKARQSAAVRLASPGSTAAGPDSLVVSLRAEYSQRLDSLADRLRAANIPLLFTIFPSHLSVYGMNSGEQLRWVEQTATAAGLGVVNYSSALRGDGRSKEALYLFPYDAHPSPAGYAVVADVLEDALLTSPLLARRCAAPRQAELGSRPRTRTMP